jgi:Ca-activated chloride channel family protein
MQNRLPMLRDQEVRRCPPVADEPGFGALTTEKGLLPLKALDVQSRIDGLLARITLRQTFVNGFAEALEATYSFPLPDRAAVTRFRLEVAGRIVEGVLQERGQARETYEKAIREGKQAAIAEEERPGVFTLRVGNLPPGASATVQLTLTGPLIYSDGEATFRFPLVVAPRYIPGTPLPGPCVGDGTVPDTDAVPDASRITPPVLLPGQPNPVRLSLAVEVQPGRLMLSDFRSSLHTTSKQVDPDGTLHFALQPGERLDRDFILRFRIDDSAIRTTLTLQPDAEGSEGTFVLTVVPPRGSVTTARPRDVVFVLDRSGSMGGWKMTAARRAIGRMVDTLTEHDRFTVLAFDNAIETPPAAGNGLIEATDRQRFRVTEFLGKIDARGGTELAEPLQQAVALLSAGKPERDRVLVLVTDGQVGNEDQILQELGKKLQGIRIFTLGIDQAVNEGFLRRFAGLGGGYAEVVESEDRLDEVMTKVHRRIGTPVLTGLKVEPDGLRFDPATLTPARLPDLFPGTPLVIAGRYQGSPRGGISLQGRDEAGQMRLEKVAGVSSENPVVASVWARGHVRELEDRYATGSGDRSALEKEIVAVSLRFGVLCRFTAFVAVDVKEVVNDKGELHRVVQQVEWPAGWEDPRMRRESIDMLALAGGVGYAAMPSAPGYRLAARARGSKLLGGFLGGMLSKSAGEPDDDDLNQTMSARPAMLRKVPPSPPPKATSPSLLDLSAYRQRARELYDRLQASTTTDAALRRRELGVIGVQLEALLDDLKSVGAADTDVAPLQKVLEDVRQFLAQNADTELDRVWQQCLSVLQDFAGSKKPGRKKSFWK